MMDNVWLAYIMDVGKATACSLGNLQLVSQSRNVLASSSLL